MPLVTFSVVEVISGRCSAMSHLVRRHDHRRCRHAAGSSVRWLTPTERDELVRADLASGLQTLAR